MFSQKHLLGTDEDETAEMSGEKLIFTHQSFTEMKEALNIIEEKDSGHLGQMKMEFDEKLLKIRIFYNNPVSNPKRCILIYRTSRIKKRVRKMDTSTQTTLALSLMEVMPVG